MTKIKDTSNIFLRYGGTSVEGTPQWELILLFRSEGSEKVLASFLTGTKNDPGYLAHWALEETKLRGKA